MQTGYRSLQLERLCSFNDREHASNTDNDFHNDEASFCCLEDCELTGGTACNNVSEEEEGVIALITISSLVDLRHPEDHINLG